MATTISPIDPLQEWIRQMLAGGAATGLNAQASYTGPVTNLLDPTHVPGFEASKWADTSSKGPDLGQVLNMVKGKGAETKATKEAKSAETTPPPAAPSPTPQAAMPAYEGITPEVEDRIRKKAKWNLMAGVSPTASVGASLALEQAKKQQYEDQVFAATINKYAKSDMNDPKVQQALAVDMITTGGDKGIQYGTQILTNLNTQMRLRESINLQANKQMSMANQYAQNLRIMKERPGTPEAQQAYYQNEGLRALWKTDEFTLAQRALANPQLQGAMAFVPEIAQQVESGKAQFDPQTKLPIQPSLSEPEPKPTPTIMTYEAYAKEAKRLNPNADEETIRQRYILYKRRAQGAQ